MSATGLELFDKTLQTTNIWLDEIMRDLGPDRQIAWKALTVVLHALRDRLPVDNAAKFSAQLPLLVRGAFYHQYEPSKQPTDEQTLEAFVSKVEAGLVGAKPVDPQLAIRTVFRTLSRNLTAGEIEKVKHSLPSSIREFWSNAER